MILLFSISSTFWPVMYASYAENDAPTRLEQTQWLDVNAEWVSELSRESYTLLAETSVNRKFILIVSMSKRLRNVLSEFRPTEVGDYITISSAGKIGTKRFIF